MTRSGAVKVAFGTMAIAFLALSLTCVTPTSAQTPFATPTPLPAIATSQAVANSAQAAAAASNNEAAQLEARAAEIRNNAAVQAQQAAQAIADARAAAASQNAAAVGEAIGRADGDLSQLKASVDGQAAIIGTLTASNADKDAKISTLRGQVDRASANLVQEQMAHKAAQDNFDALKKYQADHQNDSTLGSIPALFVFIAFSALIVILLVVVIANRREPPKDDPPPLDGQYTVVEDDKPNDED